MAALYSHYCARGDEGGVTGTVRCPTLPSHFKYDVHDVASTFKRFLAGVPGGILGSVALFDAFVSIQNQLHTDPNLPARKTTQIRSRLIALAIATLKSQYRRELICAVFGLLSMIGHAAEANNKNEYGESLPTSDLMGYGPLGIVFGPLLIGDLLEDYDLRLPNPFSGLIVLPTTPPKSRKERQKEKQKSNTSSHDTMSIASHMDKIKIVNGITEMLIIHWRDVVSCMRISQALRVIGRSRNLTQDGSKRQFLGPSASDAFVPHIWDNGKALSKTIHKILSTAPTGYVCHPSVGKHVYTNTSIPTGCDDHFESTFSDQSLADSNGILLPKKRRSKSQPVLRKRLSGTKSMSTLSKTVEERVSEVSGEPASMNASSYEIKSPAVRLDDESYSKANGLLSIVTSNQSTAGGDIITKGKSRPQIRSRTGRNQNRVRLLPRKQSTRSLPEKYALKREVHSSLTRSFSPDVTSGEATLQVSERREMYRSELSEPEVCSSLSDRRPILPGQCSSLSIGSTSLRPIPKPLVAMGAAMDHLNKVSPQEDLASLADLAGVLLRESEESKTRPRDISIRHIESDQERSVAEAFSRNSVSRSEESCASSSSSMRKLFPARRTSISKGHARSGSDSSPCSIFVSRRRKGTRKSNSNMARDKLLDSRTTNYEASKLSARGNDSATKASDSVYKTGPAKTAVKHRDIHNPIQASPLGTVKALVAKFSLGTSSLPVASPGTKASVADGPVNQESPRGGIVSPYTRNPPSIRSRRSAVSDKPAKEVHSPSKVDLDLDSPKNRRIPVSQKQFWSSPNNKLSSHIARRSREGIISLTGVPSDDTRRQCGPPDYSISPDPSVKASKPIKKASTPQLRVPNNQAACKHPASAPESENPKKPWIATRNNSELHGQIQTLQQQLAAKTEETRHLRQQLEVRSHPDVGMLAENLMEARVEIQFWKSRAELYEKQVGIMRKTSSRTISGQSEGCSAKAAGRLDQSNINYSEDEDVI